MDSYEKLGTFYLGRLYELGDKKTTDELLLYDSKDLLTHAVCVGMTGSGKTGLCVTILEEAAIDGIPVLVIDPKGDLSNLLLTFPALEPRDFGPWINADDARRSGVSPEAYAKEQAQLWRDGLASWDQSGERIRRLKDSADFTIYTPGSEAGMPVSILASFAAPPPPILEDGDLLRDRVQTTATSLLGLLGVEADPIQSREHILISTLLEDAWRRGEDLDLGTLIQRIQNPPMTRVGVLELESFYAAKDRFSLAMSLNNLLAAPGFETWLTGEPLDVDRMLYTPTGKPRVSIFSIAHLSDNERMFFVSLLLNQTLGWMRTRRGTTSLRAILYMDEIFGYIPPVANPPSKMPFLTLLKQARAYGVGLVLATQNPVDLDYKGLSNTGTWLIGRLQTDRDKQRLLDGLEGASAGSDAAFDRKQMEETLAGLGKRVFLMHNVHEDAPVVFHTRWAMSYLAGPLTRQQIKTLMDPRKAMASAAVHAPTGGASVRATAGAVPPAARPTAPTPGSAPPEAGLRSARTRPVLPPDIPQVFLPVREATGEKPIVYQPGLLGIADVHYVESRKGLEHSEACTLLVHLREKSAAIEWRDAHDLELEERQLERKPTAEADFGELPPKASDAKSYTLWKRSLTDSLYRTRRFELFRSPTFKEISKPGESEREFRIRLAERAREERDRQTEKLRKKYAAKLTRLEDRIRRAELAVDRESEQAKQQKMQTAISFGATLLSAFLGRKRVSIGTLGRATTTARGVGRSAKEREDVARARDNVAALKRSYEELQAEFDAEVDRLEERFDVEAEEFEMVTLKPRKTDIDVKLVALAWAPYERTETGAIEAAWE